MWAIPSRMPSKGTYQQAGGSLKIHVLFTFFAISSCLLPYSVILAQDDNDDIVFRLASAVEKLCALPSERGRILEYDGSVEGDVIVRLLGVKGQGTINKKEWTGVEDVLKQERAADRADARQCVRELVPVFFKAYGIRSELQNVMQHEIFIQDKFEKSDPALRAVAFRDAFRAVHLFRVDLTASKKTGDRYLTSEGIYESNIASPIENYDIASGYFSEYKQQRSDGLVGHISGNTIFFKKGDCSGNLRNVEGTWNFEGSVSCGNSSWNGEFNLR